MKILLSAYSCEPNRGSELEVGWQMVKELSRVASHLTVVTKNSSEQAIAQYRALHDPENVQFANVHFIYYNLPSWIVSFKSSLLGAQINCYLWEIGLFFFLRKRFKKHEFDVARKITIASYRFPSFIWYFAKKFVWGPFCSGERFPLRFLRAYSLEGAIQELFRLFMRRMALLDPLILVSLYKADELIAITHDTKEILPAFARRKTTVLDKKHNHVDMSHFDQYTVSDSLQDEVGVRLLYIGRLLEWKGVMLVLRALKQINKKVKYQFIIMGEGPAKSHYEEFVRQNELNVKFISPVGIPRRQLPAYYLSHDLFVFPGLHGTGGHVILEAQLYRLPVLMLDVTAPENFKQYDVDIIITTDGKTVDQIVDVIAQHIISFSHKSIAQKDS